MSDNMDNASDPGGWARTGGEWFLKILQSLGVKYVFGTSGGGMLDIQDAMTEVKAPIWIQGLHEFCSVCAAVGYSLAAEDISVALIDRVSGTTNAMGAFYVAHQNYAPVVIFASQNEPALAGKLPDGRARAAIHYHTWQSMFTTPWMKWRYELSNLDILPQSIMKACMVSMAEPRGPTYMTLSQDLMARRVNPSPLPFGMERYSTSGSVADEASVLNACELLLDADDPVVVAMNMGRHASAVPRLVELAALIGAGVVDGRNFMNFPVNHPLFLGFTEWTGSLENNPHAIGADLLLNIETHYEYPFGPSQGRRSIDVAADPAMLQGGPGGDYGGNPYPADIRLVGDSTLILEQLANALRKMMDPPSRRASEERRAENRARHEGMISKWRREAEAHFDDDPVSAYRIADELNLLWDQNTTWVNTSITATKALARGIALKAPGSYFGNYSGLLGAVPAMAYGVALARPREKVVAMVGDGEFAFGNPVSVLWTCSHYHIPVLYIVFNNACWGADWFELAQATLGLAASSRDYQCVDIDEPRIDFAGIARGLKVESQTIKHPDEAADKGANIVCFPEGYPGPYRGPPTYSALEKLSAKAKERKVYVLAGFVEKTDKFGLKNVFFLSQRIIGPDGKLVGIYRRVQPNMPEVDRFLMGDKIIAPGDDLFVHKTIYGNLGFLICSEIWCPELARVLALKGADIIFAPIGGAIYEIAENWRCLLRARAAENHVYIVAPQNLFGMEEGLATIVGPEDVIAESKKPGVVVATLDLDRLKWLREHTQRMEIPKPYKSIPGMLRYRRPELYKKICEPQPDALDFHYFKRHSNTFNRRRKIR